MKNNELVTNETVVETETLGAEIPMEADAGAVVESTGFLGGVKTFVTTNKVTLAVAGLVVAASTGLVVLEKKTHFCKKTVGAIKGFAGKLFHKNNKAEDVTVEAKEVVEETKEETK